MAMLTTTKRLTITKDEIEQALRYYGYDVPRDADWQPMAGGIFLGLKITAESAAEAELAPKAA